MGYLPWLGMPFPEQVSEDSAVALARIWGVPACAGGAGPRPFLPPWMRRPPGSVRRRLLHTSTRMPLSPPPCLWPEHSGRSGLSLDVDWTRNLSSVSDRAISEVCAPASPPSTIRLRFGEPNSSQSVFRVRSSPCMSQRRISGPGHTPGSPGGLRGAGEEAVRKESPRNPRSLRPRCVVRLTGLSV